jgi:Zn-dependent protease with chaperone function
MADLQPESDRRSFSPAAGRESFVAAIARHRRACWRVTAACVAAVIVLSVVTAILMAPLLACLVALGFDAVNLVTPAPDVMAWVVRQMDPLLSSKAVSWMTLVRVGAIAAVPGLVLMSMVTLALQRVWKTSPLFDAGDLPGRPPDRSALAEERLANVVEEMAIAAGVPVPRIVVVPGGVNAAACGRDASRVTLLVGDGSLTSIGREQLEGMMADLVASIANGDMTIGLRVTTTLALFGLIARAGSAFNDRQAFWQTAKLWRVFVAPTSANTVALLGVAADPLGDPAPAGPTVRPAQQDGSLTWREWLSMPLMGPVLIGGFLTGLLSQLLLEPLIAAAWRQRKYMADATAVELTRDPDALAGALVAIARGQMTIAPWAAHLAVAADRNQAGPFGPSMVPIFPSMDRRLAALSRMGAHVAPKPHQRMPWPFVVFFAGLVSVVVILMCVVVYLLVIVSAALSGLFTFMPAAFLHFLLRWIARSI